MNIYSVSLLAFAYGGLILVVLVLSRRMDAVSVRFSVFCFFVLGWAATFAFWFSQSYSYRTTLFLTRMGNLFAVFIPISWLHFIMEFIGNSKKNFFVFNYAVASFLALLSFNKIFISGLHSFGPFDFYTSPGPLFHIFTLIFFILVTLGFYYLLSAYRTASGVMKRQLKYLILGAFVGFSSSSATFLPVYKIYCHPVLHEALLALMPAFPLLIGIALIKYGLFDMQHVAKIFQKDKLAAIGTLATSINHEIRNPRYVIKGLVESHYANLDEGVYKDADEARKQSDHVLKKAMEHADRAMDIMKRLSDFAKQSPNGEAHAEAVNVDETLDHILPLVKHELELEKIELVREIPETLPPVWMDKRHLEEILFNLVVNACQAMKDNGGKLSLSAASHNGTVQCLISDNGPGIAPDKVTNIFEPFYTTKDSGTGLGLYIVKDLIERNRGKIEVSSRIGVGTTFTFELSSASGAENQ